MPSLTYTKPDPIYLKEHPEFTEQWLQDRIVEDPTILGLGEVVVVERERRQEKAGRLDLLLADPDENRRYEVELQLGATDEAHIVRTIEYWDIERRRYPGYEHCAVIVAEDITSRFVNLLGLFGGTIPLIAIQLNAIRVGSSIVLNFIRVLDRVSLRRDDEAETKAAPADREYWNGRSSPQVVEMADQLLSILNERAARKQQLKYNRYFIGLSDGTRSRNFVYFRPRKQFLRVLAEVNEVQPWITRLTEAGLEATDRDNRVAVNVSPKELAANRELITTLLHEAVDQFQE